MAKYNLLYVLILFIAASCGVKTSNQRSVIMVPPTQTENAEIKPVNSSRVNFALFREVITKNCHLCHGQGSEVGNFAALKSEESWLLSDYVVPGKPLESKIYLYLKKAEGSGPKSMPPGEALASEQINIIKEYIEDLAEPEIECGTTTLSLRKLNSREYRNTVRALLRQDPQGMESWPPDAKDALGFERAPDALGHSVTSVLFMDQTATQTSETYLQDNALAISQCDAEDDTCQQSAMQLFLEKAFRGPNDAATIARYLAFWQQEKDPALLLNAVMLSPRFVFHLHKGDRETPKHELYNLATRMSYLLWAAPPDATLLQKVKNGTLADARAQELEIKRLLHHNNSSQFVKSFMMSWLGANHLETHSAHGAFTESLKDSLHQELILTLHDFVKSDRPLEEFFTFEYSYMNDKLRRHYGLPESGKESFHRVPLPEQSKGIHMRGGIHAALSEFPAPMLFRKGNWVLSRLLCDEPAGEVADVETPESGDIFEHSANPACKSCHIRIDPIASVFTEIDPLGRTTGEDPARIFFERSLYGQSFESLPQMFDIVSKHQRFIGCFNKMLYGYTFGTIKNDTQRCQLQKFPKEGSLSKMLLHLMQNEQFTRTR